MDHGDDSEAVPRLRREVVDLKKSLVDSSDRVGVLEKEKKKVDEAVVALKERVGSLVTDNKALSALIVSYQKIEKDLTDSLDKTRKDQFVQSGQFETDLGAVREELRLSREESLKAFEEGYQACWARANRHGYAMGDHTFDVYCGELARERDGAASSTRVVAADP